MRKIAFKTTGAAHAAIMCLLIVAGAASAEDLAKVQELEAACEKEREARLKPLRDAEIARCKSSGKEPDYCERYWKDLGAPTRLPSGRVRPRMFNDLPECVAAREARRKAAMD